VAANEKSDPSFSLAAEAGTRTRILRISLPAKPAGARPTFALAEKYGGFSSTVLTVTTQHKQKW